MNKEPVFSEEYTLDNMTDSQPDAYQEAGHLAGDENIKEIEKIEGDYALSKPRRKIIQARIIR